MRNEHHTPSPRQKSEGHQEAPRHIRGWRRAVWQAADWAARHSYIVAAIIVGAPFAVLTMIAYSNGYTGWIEMLSDWLTAD